MRIKDAQVLIVKMLGREMHVQGARTRRLVHQVKLLKLIQVSTHAHRTLKRYVAIREIEEKLSSVTHKIVVLSGKGGVGKSTVSSQIALGLARMGFEVGLMDIDICGPSIPRMMGLEGQEVHQSNEGWEPVYVNENLGVMSIGFLLTNQDDAVIWRGPRKNGLIKQFLTDVTWGVLDFLVIDSMIADVTCVII